jgi:hypothetical protein
LKEEETITYINNEILLKDYIIRKTTICLILVIWDLKNWVIVVRRVIYPIFNFNQEKLVIYTKHYVPFADGPPLNENSIQQKVAKTKRLQHRYTSFIVHRIKCFRKICVNYFHLRSTFKGVTNVFRESNITSCSKAPRLEFIMYISQNLIWREHRALAKYSNDFNNWERINICR